MVYRVCLGLLCVLRQIQNCAKNRPRMLLNYSQLKTGGALLKYAIGNLRPVAFSLLYPVLLESEISDFRIYDPDSPVAAYRSLRGCILKLRSGGDIEMALKPRDE